MTEVSQGFPFQLLPLHPRLAAPPTLIHRHWHKQDLIKYAAYL